MSISSSGARSQIAARILDAFPSGSYALTGLLALVDIVESHDIDTAAVECIAQPRLLINPLFVDQWAATPEKLLMLVMHELHHVLLGHTRLLRRTTPLDNLVFDAVINALLCRMFPTREHTAFFTDFYDDRKLPDCLLRPPRGWMPSRPVRLPPALTGSGDAAAPLQEVYRALYSEAGVGYSELYEALRAAIDDDCASAVALLGDHSRHGGSSADGHLNERSPLLFEAVRSIVERWPSPPDPIEGRSMADALRDESIRPVRQPSNRALLRRLLHRIGAAGRGHARRGLQADASEAFAPMPTTDRRSAVLRALGHPPLLYPMRLPHRRRIAVGERVHVYLDVSASIGSHKQALFGAVLDCRESVHPVVHQFSTVVSDVSLAAVRRGEVHTTGGTSIHCVAAHMREHRIRRAVLITDGFVGAPGGSDLETLTRARVGVALTSGSASRHDLREVADAWAELQLPEDAD